MPMTNNKFPISPRRKLSKTPQSPDALNVSLLPNSSNPNIPLFDDESILSWIDSIKLRASETFSSQQLELKQLRDETQKESLREKYRHEIVLEQFDRLSEYLKTKADTKIPSNSLDDSAHLKGHPTSLGPNEESFHLLLSDSDIIEIISSEGEDESEQPSHDEELSSTSESGLEKSAEHIRSDIVDVDSDMDDNSLSEYHSEQYHSGLIIEEEEENVPGGPNISTNHEEVIASIDEDHSLDYDHDIDQMDEYDELSQEEGHADDVESNSYEQVSQQPFHSLPNRRPKLSDTTGGKFDPSLFEHGGMSSSSAEEESGIYNDDSEVSEADMTPGVDIDMASHLLNAMNNTQVIDGEDEYDIGQSMEHSFKPKVEDQEDYEYSFKDDDENQETIRHLEEEERKSQNDEIVVLSSEDEEDMSGPENASSDSEEDSHLSGPTKSDNESNRNLDEAHDLFTNEERRISLNVINHISYNDEQHEEWTEEATHANTTIDPLLNSNLFANIAQEALADIPSTSNALSSDYPADVESDFNRGQVAEIEQSSEIIDDMVKGNEQAEIDLHSKTTEEQENIVSEGSLADSEADVENIQDQGIMIPKANLKYPVFKTIKQELPEVVLHKLEETEKRFHIKLHTLENLKSELGITSIEPEESDSFSATGNTIYEDAQALEDELMQDILRVAQEMAEVHEQIEAIENPQKFVETELIFHEKENEDMNSEDKITYNHSSSLMATLSNLNDPKEFVGLQALNILSENASIEPEPKTQIVPTVLPRNDDSIEKDNADETDVLPNQMEPESINDIPQGIVQDENALEEEIFHDATSSLKVDRQKSTIDNECENKSVSDSVPRDTCLNTSFMNTNENADSVKTNANTNGRKSDDECNFSQNFQEGITNQHTDEEMFSATDDYAENPVSDTASVIQEDLSFDSQDAENHPGQDSSNAEETLERERDRIFENAAEPSADFKKAFCEFEVSSGNKVTVIEPVTSEEVLMTFETETIVELKSIFPTSIEEPTEIIAETTEADVIGELIEITDNLPPDIQTPTEVIEPEDIDGEMIVESFEETTDVVLPTFIQEMESLRGTPVDRDVYPSFSILNKKSDDESLHDEPSRKRLSDIQEESSRIKRPKPSLSSFNPLKWFFPNTKLRKKPSIPVPRLDDVPTENESESSSEAFIEGGAKADQHDSSSDGEGESPIDSGVGFGNNLIEEDTALKDEGDLFTSSEESNVVEEFMVNEDRNEKENIKHENPTDPLELTKESTPLDSSEMSEPSNVADAKKLTHNDPKEKEEGAELPIAGTQTVLDTGEDEAKVRFLSRFSPEVDGDDDDDDDDFVDASGEFGNLEGKETTIGGFQFNIIAPLSENLLNKGKTIMEELESLSEASNDESDEGIENEDMNMSSNNYEENRGSSGKEIGDEVEMYKSENASNSANTSEKSLPEKEEQKSQKTPDNIALAPVESILAVFKDKVNHVIKERDNRISSKANEPEVKKGPLNGIESPEDNHQQELDCQIPQKGSEIPEIQQNVGKHQDDGSLLMQEKSTRNVNDSDMTMHPVAEKRTHPKTGKRKILGLEISEDSTPPPRKRTLRSQTKHELGDENAELVEHEEKNWKEEKPQEAEVPMTPVLGEDLEAKNNEPANFFHSPLKVTKSRSQRKPIQEHSSPTLDVPLLPGRRRVSSGKWLLDLTDHPALRTRSKSPIKRTIQQLSSDIDDEPLKRRRVTRSSKKKAEEEKTKEEELRGRARERR